MHLTNRTTPSYRKRIFLLCMKSARQYWTPAPAAPRTVRPPSHSLPLRRCTDLNVEDGRDPVEDRQYTRNASCITSNEQVSCDLADHHTIVKCRPTYLAGRFVLVYRTTIFRTKGVMLHLSAGTCMASVLIIICNEISWQG